MQLTLDSLVQRSEGVVAAPVQHEMVLMSVERGQYYATSGVGERLWQELDQPITVRELCGRLQKLYRVDPETCGRDVLRFLEEIRAEGLLQVLG